MQCCRCKDKFYTKLIWLVHTVDCNVYDELLYILTSVWVLCSPNAGRNMVFQQFSFINNYIYSGIVKVIQKSYPKKLSTNKWHKISYPEVLSKIFLSKMYATYSILLYQWKLQFLITRLILPAAFTIPYLCLCQLFTENYPSLYDLRLMLNTLGLKSIVFYQRQ